MSVSSVFLLLLVYTSGQAWATFLPRKSWVEGTRWERLGPVLHALNPGKFTIKEVCESLCAEVITADLWLSMLSPP